MLRSVVLVGLLAGCGATVHPPPRVPRASDELTLYRDRAFVRQHVVIDVSGGATTASIPIAAGVPAESVAVLDRGDLTSADVRDVEASPGGRGDDASHAGGGDASHAGGGDDASHAGGDDASHAGGGDDASHAGGGDDPPRTGVLRLDVTAPRPGHYPIELAYVTDRLQWDVAYTMTTTPARDYAVLSGAIAIRNTTGLALHGFARVIDAELGTWRTRIADRIANALMGGKHGTSPAVAPYVLGELELGPETRITMPGLSAPREMRAVLVYDPIGTSLDSPSVGPVRDLALGVVPPPADHVTESFEIQRDPHVPAGLPAGTVRLFERRPDGSLAVLGESRLFDPTTRTAPVDTIPIGTADGVTGHRERREITIDDDRHRLTEEFVITIDNQRPHPIHALAREHLYRGQSWTLAYYSAPAHKEGPQEVALRTDVPARSHAKIMYVVVYTWPP